MSILDADLETIRNQIEHAERPLIFYDDDADGLASFLLCYAANNRSIGIRAARGPKLHLDFARRVEENQPDLILILDKPLVDEDFFEHVNTPTIWIDHHGIQAQKPHEWKIPNLQYYNPLLHDPNDNRPVSYWMWKCLQTHLWIAACGTIGDWDDSLMSEFKKQYPLYVGEYTDVKDILYKSRLGKLVRIFNFVLKGKHADITKAVNALKHVKEPDELLLGDSSRGKFVMKHVRPIREEYERQLTEAKQTEIDGSVFVHIFHHVKISLVTEVANELLVWSNAPILIVGREDQDRIKFSMRSHIHDLVPIVEKALVQVNGYGGGHKEACGGSVVLEDWPTFLDAVKEQLA